MNNLSIYQEKILGLAAKNKKIIALKDFNRSFEMRNPMCGDEVKVRIKLVEDKIIDISAVVRGCALCEASAGLVVELFDITFHFSLAIFKAKISFKIWIYEAQILFLLNVIAR